MRMIVYRIATKQFAHDLSGAGAASSSHSRWNSKGVPLLYTSLDPSTCLLEMLVHLPPVLVNDHVTIKLKLPSTKQVGTVSEPELPADWRQWPPGRTTQQVGDTLVRGGKLLALRVPSAVLPSATNLIINPYHPLSAGIEILEVNPLVIDPRLLWE